MADFSNIDKIDVCIEPYVFTDTIGGVKYIGTSASFSDVTAPNWRIKKEWACTTVCYMGFPDGDQGFKFIWNCRCSYTYL
jgi:hypothetical protein